MPGAVVLLTGRSFSGKSTLAAALAEDLPAVHLAYDAILGERGLRGGTGLPAEAWLRTNALAHERARAHLADGATVVVDACVPRFLRLGRRRARRLIRPRPQFKETRRTLGRAREIRAAIYRRPDDRRDLR